MLPRLPDPRKDHRLRPFPGRLARSVLVPLSTFFAVAVLELAATATRAGLVAARAGVLHGQGPFLFAGQDPHHLVGEPPLLQQVGHQAHRVIDVVEEGFVAGAQVVEAWFAVGSQDESVARALSIAGESDFALAAIARQGIALVVPELLLLFRAG